MPRGGRGKKQEVEGEQGEAHVSVMDSRNQAYSQANDNKDISLRGLDICYKETVCLLP